MEAEDALTGTTALLETGAVVNSPNQHRERSSLPVLVLSLEFLLGVRLPYSDAASS